MSVRRTMLGLALVTGLAGCGTLPPLIPGLPRPEPATSATTPASGSPSASPKPAPTAAPTPSSAGQTFTVAAAEQAFRQWVAAYNKALKKPKWWRSDDTVDALFTEGALHEGVLERTREAMGRGPGHRPIAVQGAPVIYLVRPENQPGFADWFMAQATYQDAEGKVRRHLLSFLRRREESSFKLAVATPVHSGRRVPEAALDADGYISMPGNAIALAVTLEYQNFWNHEKEGQSGYRLAKDSFSRKAFPEVSKGAYVAFKGRGSIYGFTTAGGGSFFLFAMLNDTQHVNQVLSEAVLVPKGADTIQEIGANWFS